MFVFVADLFKEHYVGGAELTFDCLIDSVRLPSQKGMSSQISVATMEQHKDKFWVFGNYAQLPANCMMYAIKNLNYCVVEFDYKYCKYRTEHLHLKNEGPCDCAEKPIGKLVAMFMAKAKKTFWMSQGQLDTWCGHYSLLSNNAVVLSSAFSDESLQYISSLDKSSKNNKWVILGSNSWIKGKEDAIKYAEDNNLEYEVLWGLDYKQFLSKLAQSRGLIHLPRGYDTCPRMVIEAKLLGCELILNEFVQHKDENWFNQPVEEIYKYLMDRPSVFQEQLLSIVETGLPPVSEKQREEKHFSIIIPSYNCESWVDPLVDSVLGQDYENYDVYFVDDASTDATQQKVLMKLNQYPQHLKEKFNFHRNEDNKKALYNICSSIEKTREDTIVILLDGDDLFSSKNVLSYLNEVYSKEDIWLTTGSYVETGTGRVVKSMELPQEAWRLGVRKFREPAGHPNVFSHLRTFKKKLYQKINPEDLLDKNGQHYRCTFDRALMYPMIEMAGPEHHKVIKKILYVYNRQNPLAVDRVDRTDQLRIEQHLRSQQPYDRIQL
tara:strand:+ start:10874 stop:12520 length:1647 start_codon:yes stop_codon:yes gene_type:complete